MEYVCIRNKVKQCSSKIYTKLLGKKEKERNKEGERKEGRKKRERKGEKEKGRKEERGKGGKKEGKKRCFHFTKEELDGHPIPAHPEHGVFQTL